MAQEQIIPRPVSELYVDGNYTCYDITHHVTAWIDNSSFRKRLILGWGTTKDRAGMYEADREKGVVVQHKELDDLKKHLQNGVFGRKLIRARAEQTRETIRLDGAIFRNTNIVIADLPQWGFMITFSQGKQFCKIGLKRLVALAEFMGMHVSEGLDAEAEAAEKEYDEKHPKIVVQFNNKPLI